MRDEGVQVGWIGGTRHPDEPIRDQRTHRLAEITAHPQHRDACRPQGRSDTLAIPAVAGQHDIGFVGAGNHREFRPALVDRRAIAGAHRVAERLNAAIRRQRIGEATPHNTFLPVRQAHAAAVALLEDLATLPNQDDPRCLRQFAPTHLLVAAECSPPRSAGTRSNPMSNLAALFAHPATIATICGGLVVWAIWSGFRLHRRTDTLIRALRSLTAGLRGIEDRDGLAERYEALREEFGEDPILGGRWKEFSRSLIISDDEHVSIRRTAGARAWFDMGSLLRSAKLHSRYHAAMPNMLVGVGLFVTFLGLAIALASAGEIVGAPDSATRTVALKSLLDTASVKFVTSLVGLALSIGYALYRNSRLRRAERALDVLAHQIERLIPETSGPQLQAEANIVLVRQTAQLEIFSNKLAISIAEKLDLAFDNRLGDHIGPLGEALNRLTETMQGFGASTTERNEGAVAAMLEKFLERLHDGTGDQMQKVAETLGGLGERLEGVQTGLSEAAARMSQSADDMAKRMGEGAEAALARVTDQIGGLAETLREVAEKARDTGDGAGRELATRIQAAAAGFEESARTVARTIADATAEMERRMRQQGDDSATRLAVQMEAMIGELRALAENSRAAGNSAIDALAQRIANAAEGFEAAAGKVAESLGASATQTGDRFDQGAKEAVDRVANATEAMRTALEEVLNRMQSTVTGAGEVLREGSAAGADVLQRTLSQSADAFDKAVLRAADYLRESGTNAGNSLRDGGSDAGTRMREAAGALAARAESTSAQIASAGIAAERIATQAVALERAVKDAAEPLASTAQSLRTTGEAVRDAARPLEASASRLATAAEQAGGLAQRIEQAQDGTRILIASMTRTVEQFSGVDTHLAGIMGKLQDGLQSYQRSVQEFAIASDSNISKSITHLQALVHDLQEALDSQDTAPRRR